MQHFRDLVLTLLSASFAHIQHASNTHATTSTHIDVTFNRLADHNSAWKHFQDPTRWPMAQGLQLFVGDMCLYDHVGQPQHADWHQYFTACRLAPLFHSRPIGTTISQQADWHHYFTAGRLATTQLSISAVIRQHAFKQRRTISPGLIDHRQP